MWLYVTDPCPLPQPEGLPPLSSITTLHSHNIFANFLNTIQKYHPDTFPLYKSQTIQYLSELSETIFNYIYDVTDHAYTQYTYTLLENFSRHLKKCSRTINQLIRDEQFYSQTQLFQWIDTLQGVLVLYEIVINLQQQFFELVPDELRELLCSLRVHLNREQVNIYKQLPTEIKIPQLRLPYSNTFLNILGLKKNLTIPTY